MAGEKSFENRLKKWLESEGIYRNGSGGTQAHHHGPENNHLYREIW